MESPTEIPTAGEPSHTTEQGRADDAAPSGLFVRKSSGLVRELGIRDAFGINIGGVSPGGIGFFFFVILAGFPGTDLTLPIIIAFAGAVFLSLMYAQLVASMPRSGADFVYISRVLKPWLGAAAGVAFFIYIVYNAGANVAVFSNTFLPFLFQTLGDVLGWSSLEDFAGTLSEQFPALVSSALLSLLVVWILSRRVATAARVIFLTAVAGIVALVVLCGLFVFNGPDSFQSAFNGHVGDANAYDKMIKSAEAAGGVTGVRWSAVWSSIALAALLYGGATYANYTGGELRRPGRTFLSSTLVCLSVAFGLTLLAWLTTRHTLGLEFTQSVGFLSGADPDAYGKLAGDVSPFIPSFGLVLADDPISKLIMAFGFTAGDLALVLAIAIIGTRLAFALSFDRIFPTAVADVRGKTHAPWAAAVLVGAGSFLFAYLTIYTSVLTSTRNFTLILVAVFALASLTAALLPYLRRDLYDASPKMLGARLFGLPAITVVGAVSFVYQAVLLYLAATKTQVSGGYDTASVLTLAGTSIAGIVLYGISRLQLRARGLNLDGALQELPPE